MAVFAYAALALPVRIGVAYSVGRYRFLWRHASLVELERLVFAGATAAAITFVIGAILIQGLGLAPVRLPPFGPAPRRPARRGHHGLSAHRRPQGTRAWGA